MGGVDERYNQGNDRITTVIFRVGEDLQVGCSEGGFCENTFEVMRLGESNRLLHLPKLKIRAGNRL